MIHDTDYDRGDWEHEVKRDKALDRIAALEAQVAALEKDNDGAHELAEHYRVENGRLREALEELVHHDSHRDPGEVALIARTALSRTQ